MNARRLMLAQAVRGPILLITIGILFAMHQAGVLSFSRTWPLIVIVLGVMKLIERMAAPPSAFFQPQYNGQTYPPQGGPGSYPPQAGQNPYPPQGGQNS